MGGHWHWHNSMGAAFSGTDQKLHDKKDHTGDFMVYLVTNEKEEYSAKLVLNEPVHAELDMRVTILSTVSSAARKAMAEELAACTIENKTPVFSIDDYIGKAQGMLPAWSADLRKENAAMDVGSWPGYAAEWDAYMNERDTPISKGEKMARHRREVIWKKKGAKQ
jgi:hypothetical protein